MTLTSTVSEATNRTAASRLHVLAAQVIDDAAAVIGGADHAAERDPADRGVGGDGVRQPCTTLEVGVPAPGAGLNAPAVMPGPPSPSEPAPFTHS